MRDVHTAIEHNQRAVSALIAAARAVPLSQWAEPLAPEKWSPAQIIEHVALTYEISAKLVDGTLKQPAIAAWLRPMMGLFIRATIMRTGRFPKSKAAPAFQPSASPADVETIALRLEAASAAVERLAAHRVDAGLLTFEHPVFGRFGMADYVQFQAYHTRHHQAQLGG